MPEACQTAYRSSTPEIQTKIRRLIEVWKQRNVFEATILEACMTRLDDVDKAKGTSGKKSLMGKSLHSSSSGSGMPKELETLGPLQLTVSKISLDARRTIDTAERDYAQLNDPDVVLPTPPVHAARLTGLIKSLAAAESAVNEIVKARQALITDIERILEINMKELEKEAETMAEMSSRKTMSENKKRDVEDTIMRGLSAENTPELELETGNGNGKRSSSFVDERPEVEELTPEPEDPPVMSGAIPPGEPTTLDDLTSSKSSPINPAVAAALSGFGGGGNTSRIRVASSSSLNGSSAKRRKMSHEEANAVPDMGSMGLDGAYDNPLGDVLANLDADVEELLKQEGAQNL